MNSCIENCKYKINGQHSEECFRCCRLYPDKYEEKKEYRIEKRYYGKVVSSHTVYSFEEAKEVYKKLDNISLEDCPTYRSAVVLLFIDGKYIKIPKAERMIYTVKERMRHLRLGDRGDYAI